MRWAELDTNGVVTNAVEADEEFAQEQGYKVVLPDGKGKGWSTPDGGKTWNAPTPSPTEVGLTDAQAGITQLLESRSAFAAQIQSDMDLWANTPVGASLTQEHLDALGRMAEGFTTVMQALTDHMVLTKTILPETTADLERLVPLPEGDE